MSEKTPRFTELWDQIWLKIWSVDERRPGKAAATLRELARLCMAAAAACDEESEE